MRALLIIFITGLSFCSCKGKKTSGNEAQFDRKAILAMTDRYADAFKRKAWPDLLNIIHPRTFEFISREDFTNALDSAFNATSYKLSLAGMHVDSIYPSIRYKDDLYSLLSFTVLSDLELAYEPNPSLCSTIMGDPNGDYLDCKVNGNHVQFSMRDSAYAIFLNAKGKWFFLSRGEGAEKLVDRIIPKEVSRQFGY